MELRTAIRIAIKSKLEGDSTLQAFFQSNEVVFRYRPTRVPQLVPLITMFDFGDRGDDVVPLYDRSYQLDIWHSDLDVAEDMAIRIVQLLDHQPLAVTNPDDPYDVPGQVARVHLVSDTDSTEEDADLVRKTLRFRILCYQYDVTYDNN